MFIHIRKVDARMDWEMCEVTTVTWLNEIEIFGENPKQMKFGGWNNNFWSLQMNWEKSALGSTVATFYH
jgi:hypothetical protein